MSSSTLLAVVTGLSQFAASYNFSSVGVAILILDTMKGREVSSWAASALDCAVFLGSILGMIAFGYAGDRWGRRVMFLVTTGLALAGALLSALGTWGNLATIESLIVVWRCVSVLVSVSLSLSLSLPLSLSLSVSLSLYIYICTCLFIWREPKRDRQRERER